jgi:hypothetical protein
VSVALIRVFINFRGYDGRGIGPGGILLNGFSYCIYGRQSGLSSHERCRGEQLADVQAGWQPICKEACPEERRKRFEGSLSTGPETAFCNPLSHLLHYQLLNRAGGL